MAVELQGQHPEVRREVTRPDPSIAAPVGEVKVVAGAFAGELDGAVTMVLMADMFRSTPEPPLSGPPRVQHRPGIGIRDEVSRQPDDIASAGGARSLLRQRCDTRCEGSS